jgi:hypothetical protein
MALHLTPTELAEHAGLPRKAVIELCMELGVPIFQGRIDRSLFLANLGESRRDWTWVLMDSTGNLVDSFSSPIAAAAALDRILAADAENAGHVALIAYDKDGEPVDSPEGSQTPRAVRA